MLIKARFQFPEIVFGMLLAVAIFALGAAFVSSSQPPNTEQNAATEQQTKNEGGSHGKETQSLWVPTDSVGLYTLVLSIFTGILAAVSIFQGVMLLRADKTTRISADAAKRSADAAVNVELPILIMNFANLTAPGIATITPKMILPKNFWPIISFENFGRSPAQIIEGCLEWTTVKNPSELLLPPRYQNIAPYSANVVVIAKGRVPVDVPCQIFLTEKQMADISSGEQSLFIFGYLSYKDFLNEPHEVRFCMKWRPFREGENAPFGFVWDSETPAEYTKRT